MTKEEFNRQKEHLTMDFRWEEAIRLCRNYARECRQNGDIDNLASALHSLYSELTVHGGEEEARAVFDDLFALRKALAKHNLQEDGEAYALLLNIKAYTSDDIGEAIACQEEAIDIYKKLGLYDSRGFDIGLDDAFGFLGKLYCYKGDYASGIRYTTLALERALREGDSDFNLGLYLRRLGVAHLSSGDTRKARESLLKALDCFVRSSRTAPDPYADPEVIDSCRQLLAECDHRTHPDEHYKQWLI